MSEHESEPIAEMKAPKGSRKKTPPPEKAPVPAPEPVLTSEKLRDRAMITPITLPSMGIPYEGKMPEGRVLISSMTAADEKMFAAKATTSADKTTILFSRACDLGQTTPDEMVLGDRFFLLMKIRSLSYGNKYGFQSRCGDCDTQFRHEIDLERELSVTVLDESWEEPFTVDLPITGRILTCRLLRGKDERHIQSSTKRQHQKNIHDPGNPAFTMMIARHIVTINGDPVTEMPALKFTESLPVGDRQALTNAVNVHSPGFDPELEIECPHCGYISEVVLPMSTEFFRPKHST